MEAHLARESWSRKQLLQDKELRAQLGYEKRVVHRERWEEQIKYALGLGPKPAG
ncbi:MAG: hypothetical protein H6741_22945 [Alphaproteobacteria bacterium]|nr:hypothetical protein [Alphaproteobacteria bacterium]